MWDTLSWGGETQALIYDPRAKKVIAINGLGVAPTGATPEFYKAKGYSDDWIEKRMRGIAIREEPTVAAVGHPFPVGGDVRDKTRQAAGQGLHQRDR